MFALTIKSICEVFKATTCSPLIGGEEIKQINKKFLDQVTLGWNEGNSGGGLI